MRTILMLGVLAMSGLAAGPMLVTTKDVAARQGDGKTVVLHVGTKMDYEAGHVPGARLVTLADISLNGKLRLEMPEEADLRERLLKLGLGDGARVVVYAANDSIQSATRVWFTVAYAGLEAQLMDGGLAAWKAAGMEVETKPAEFAAARSLTLRPHRDWIVDAKWVEGHLKDPAVRVVDARLPEFYRGENANGMPRAGHIPGAVNVPFSTLVGGSKKFLEQKELAGRLGSSGQNVVAYCHIGMQATVVFFAARLAGLDARLYDGSFEDWSSRASLPVE